MWRLAYRNVVSHKFRTFLVSLAVSAGVAFMAGSFVLTATMNAAFDDVFSTAYRNTDVVVRSKATVEGSQGSSDQRPRVDAALVSTLQGVEGVDVVAGDLMGYAQLTKKNGEALGNPGSGPPAIGGEYTGSKLSPFSLAEGVAPGAPNEIAIDRGSAKLGKFSIGDRTTVITAQQPEQFVISGIVSFGSADNLAGASYVLFTPETASRIFNAVGKYDEINIGAKSGVSQSQLRERVAAVLPESAEALTGAQVTKENQNQLKQALSFFGYFLTFFGLVALFVGAFTINNVFSILVAQRQRESALLRAIGATKKQVLRSVVVEAFLVGVVAAVVGLFGGIGLAAGLKALLAQFGVDLPGGGIKVTSTPIIISFVAGIGITVLSAYLPARSGSRVPPIAAMRDVAIDTSARSLQRFVSGTVSTTIGVVLLVVGLFASVNKPLWFIGPGLVLTFLGVAVLGPTIARPFSRVLGAPLPKLRGITGRIAVENAARNPKRTARAASALMIGLTFVTLIAVAAASAKESINAAVDKSFSGDFVVQGPQSFDSGLSPALAQSLRSLPEVATVSPTRIGAATVDGKTAFLAGIEPATFVKILDLNVLQGNLGSLTGSQIAVRKAQADSKNWSVGQTVQMTFPSGLSEQVTVGAIYEDENQIIGPYAISLDKWQERFATPYDMLLMVNKKSSVSAEAARTAIEAAAAPYPTAKVQDQTDYKKSVSGQINTLLNIIIVLLALAVLIAALGIVCTLWLSVIERTHEIGLMRAVGMTRRQTRSSVRWESVILSLIGALQGVVLGVVFGWALQRALEDEGITVFSLPVTFVIGVTVTAAALGIIAAAWPARRAARLNVLAAIASD